MGALAHAVRSGKALYAGISNYDAAQTERASKILRDLGTPCLIHQPKYSMFERTPERGLLDVLVREGIGGIAFTPLAQGMLTGRYLNGIPADSRAGHDPRFLKPESITADKLGRIRQLDAVARGRGQSLAQMALAWVLRKPGITSALIGASRVSQIDENLGALKRLSFAEDELKAIEGILA
jgi:L-glyceraldehyde 3-phosphate reductase